MENAWRWRSEARARDSKMKILVTGGAGNLGAELGRQLRGKHEVAGADIVGDVDFRLDITEFAACRELLNRLRPDIVLHAAAWTDVDGCARDPRKALRVNGVGAHNLAVVSASLGISILYVSTNEVFDGERRSPYSEYDLAKPINAYGYSKWYGERAIASLNPRHYIARTAWLFARGGRNFIQAILGAAQAGKPLRVVTNEVANPTSTVDLAAAIARLIETERYGIYHLVNQGAASRWHFARYILDRGGFADTPVERISRHEWQRPSLPPEYTAMANIAGASVGIQLRPWQEAVDSFLDEASA